MTDEKISRRSFFETTWRVTAALAVGQGLVMGMRYLGSRQTDAAFGAVITAGNISEFPPGTVTAFETARFFLVRLEDGAFIALHSRCTHLACLVNWDEAQGEFICPCHGSQFEMKGQVVNPPAPQPLDRFPVTFEGNQVKVDTGQRIPRREVDQNDFVYPPEETT